MQESTVLADMQNKGEIMIVGAMYDINTGAVNFYE
jgi:carbonic anhydrase